MTMPKSARVNLRSSVAAIFTSTILLILFIVAFSLPAWLKVKQTEVFSRDRAHSGLWWACGLNHDHQLSEIFPEQGPVCFSLLEYGLPSWLRVTQGFAIVALFFALVSYAMWFWIVCGRDWEEKAFNILVPTWILAGICMILTVSVYAGHVDTGTETSPGSTFSFVPFQLDASLSWAFALAAIVSALWTVMGIVLLASLVCMYC